jgi:hypothetical protein
MLKYIYIDGSIMPLPQVSIKFVEEQPQSFWTKANRNEYGFW